jgi:hypothetical protein
MESTLISLIRCRGTLFLNWLVEIFLKLGIYINADAFDTDEGVRFFWSHSSLL